MNRIIDIVAGARPNFMKVAPILRALAPTPLKARLIHSGQHYDEVMSDVFFRELGLPAPDVHLGVGSGTHGQQTARILAEYEKHLLMSPPRGVVVVGDVNSTMACALAAVKLSIPVAHVEAGLRSFDRAMPEEINRIVTDAVSDVLLVSEPSGDVNLLREGVQPQKIHYVGNVMIDTLVHELPKAQDLPVPKRGFALVTLHRPSNVDNRERLVAIMRFLEKLAGHMSIVFPVHPRTKVRLQEFQVEVDGAVQLLEPFSYRQNLAHVARARLVITDSGGLQEETTFLNVPCLTLRTTTERPVTISAGTSTLVGNDWGKAEEAIQLVLEERYKRSSKIPGWDGNAAQRIAEKLCREWRPI
ncbi:MAG: UDP-N-acetylglucosamine 2-epimerase (non-hydrolyzing) [Planctomycetes bacterium]|nr:UDP-N-acetylglucosamine 2-epimerase (non-hydrolyzing) [Planctomycetota bacterium]